MQKVGTNLSKYRTASHMTHTLLHFYYFYLYHSLLAISLSFFLSLPHSFEKWRCLASSIYQSSYIRPKYKVSSQVLNWFLQLYFYHLQNYRLTILFNNWIELQIWLLLVSVVSGDWALFMVFARFCNWLAKGWWFGGERLRYSDQPVHLTWMITK